VSVLPLPLVTIRRQLRMSLTVSVQVPTGDREQLESWLRAPSVRAGLAQRARIVLLAADGDPGSTRPFTFAVRTGCAAPVDELSPLAQLLRA